MRSLLPFPKAVHRAVVAGIVAAAAVWPAHAIERGPARVRATDAPASAATASAATARSVARVIVQYRVDASVMRTLSANSPAGAAAGAAVPPQHAQVFAARLGVALTNGVPIGPRAQVLQATGISAEDLAARLATQVDVEYAVPDRRVHALRVPSDPLLLAGQASTPATGQWYLRTPGVDGEAASINAERAWDLTTGTPSIVVAVIDTGITAHPDLVGKVLPGYDFISDASTAGDGDGRDSDPTDLGDGVTSAQVGSITGCDSTDVGTSSWHGTQTAGLIGAATDNATGMASVGWNTLLLPLRALGRCGGTESDVIAAMNWAAGIGVSGVPANPNKARVINLSLGGKSGVACDTAYQNAVNAVIAQGVVVVAAAGNDGLALGAPANCTGVIAVAGLRHAGTKVGYSDLGSGVTVAAPAGNCVNATGTCLFPLLTTTNDGAYAAGNPIYSAGDSTASLGTSFSAPLVSGTVALMLAVNPALTPAQVASTLGSTARAFTTSGSAPLVAASPTTAATGASVTLTGTPVAACTAPASAAPAQNTECYCTTSTCGSGILDAGAAVTVAAGLVPTPPAGPGPAATIVSYRWAIAGTSGSATAAFSGSTTQPTATVATGGVGSFTASLTTTDSFNQVRSSSTTVAVAATAPTSPTAPATPAAPATPTTTPDTGSSSGGGGSVSAGWLLGLLAAVFALQSTTGRRRRS